MPGDAAHRAPRRKHRRTGPNPAVPHCTRLSKSANCAIRNSGRAVGRFSVVAMKQPARVLVVDDASHIRDMDERFLRGSGMETLQAANGIQALDVARRVTPDVIVTDVKMPVMDGLSLCRVLRADAATRHVRVVVVTGD